MVLDVAHLNNTVKELGFHSDGNKKPIYADIDRRYSIDILIVQLSFLNLSELFLGHIFVAIFS